MSGCMRPIPEAPRRRLGNPGKTFDGEDQRLCTETDFQLKNVAITRYLYSNAANVLRMRSCVGNLLRWIAGIGTAFKKPAEFSLQPASHANVADEPVAESAVADHKDTAEIVIGEATQVSVITAIPPDQQEIQRRRELVRTLFNDFWSGSEDKPLTFLDRLDQAQTYLNERLTARGEPWLLDANTRKMLGLPPRAN